MKLILRRLNTDDEQAFNRALERFPKENGFSFMHESLITGSSSFSELLKNLENLERGVRLPDGFVPDTLFFGFDRSGEIVGRISIRHRLNDFLLKYGGHVGYGVVPKFRGQGYAKEMLHLSLPYCRNELGLTRVLLTCDYDNYASIKTIESCGAVLQDTLSEPGMRVAKCRYWLDL